MFSKNNEFVIKKTSTEAKRSTPTVSKETES